MPPNPKHPAQSRWPGMTLMVLASLAPTLGISDDKVSKPSTERSSNVIRIELFIRKDSERCRKTLEYATGLIERQPGLELVVHDVIKDPRQLRRLWDLAKKSGHKKPGLPMVYCCRQVHFGFDTAARTGPKIQNLFTMHVYTRSTCPRCQQIKRFLPGLQQRWPGLRLAVYEITNDMGARARWNELARQHRMTPGLPLIHFSGRLIVGYRGDAITGREIESLIKNANAKPQVPPGKPAAAATRTTTSRPSRLVAASLFPGWPGPVDRLVDSAAAQDTIDDVDTIDDIPLPPDIDELPPLPDEDVVVDADNKFESTEDQPSDSIEVPFFGQLSVHSMGLPTFTFVIGLIDGFNPCAMWVLVFLLSVLVNVRSRRKMIMIAGTFVVVSGLAYFAFMAAWLNLFMLIGIARPVQVGLGCMAILIGTVNVKDFFAFGKGFSFSIPESRKPGIYKRVQKIVSAKYLTAALSGVVILAVIVNVIELLCTAGLPALYSQILMMHELPAWKNYCYLGLYIAAYMLDDSILLAIVVTTLSRRKLQESHGRWLKLISGSAILALGLAMIFKPHWLQLST